jgi:DHA3 family macrolide efflux protein-like MFS transporter
MLASVPLVVPDKHLSRAAGLNQMLQGIVTIAAPPAGALLLGVFPMYGVLAIDIVTAVVAVGCLLLIVIPQPQRTALAAKASAFKDMIAGFQYVWHSRGLAMLMALTAVLVFFFVPAFTLMPILVTEKLDGDVLKLGWLNSAFGLGMIAGGAVLGAWGGFRRRIATSFTGLMACSLGTVAVGLTSTGVLFFAGLTASLIAGMGLSVANAPLMAIVQSVVPKDMQGRVHSLFGSVNSAMMPLGLAIAGPAADAIGISSLFYVAGGATLVITFLAFFSRTLMNVETPQEREATRPAVEAAAG